MKDSQLLYLIGNLWVLSSLFLSRINAILISLFVGFTFLLFAFLIFRMEVRNNSLYRSLDYKKFEMFYDSLSNIERLLMRKKK